MTMRIRAAIAAAVILFTFEVGTVRAQLRPPLQLPDNLPDFSQRSSRLSTSGRRLSFYHWHRQLWRVDNPRSEPTRLVHPWAREDLLQVGNAESARHRSEVKIIAPLGARAVTNIDAATNTQIRRRSIQVFEVT